MGPGRDLHAAALLVAAVVGLLPARGAAAGPAASKAEGQIPVKLKVSLGYHYSTGKYGSSGRTDIGYVPLIAKASYAASSLQLTVPYLSINGSGTVVNGPTGPVRTNSGTSDGLGDVLARASYTLLPERPWIPFVDCIGRVKFPTASRSDGLGTGEFDFGLETELSWTVRGFTPFVNVGYRFLGSSRDVPLHDVWAASGGGIYRVVEEVDVGMLLDYRGAPSAASGERLDLLPFLSWRLTRHWSADSYVSAGLADGSPDVGVGLQIGYGL